MRSTTERPTISQVTAIGGVIMTGDVPLHQGAELPAGCAFVRLDGGLDFAAAPALRERLISVLRPGTRLVILDLSRVQSCDTAGLAVLIGTQRRASGQGIVVRVVAPSPPVAELLHSSGLARCLTVCPDLPGALGWRWREPAGTAAAPQALAG